MNYNRGIATIPLDCCTRLHFFNMKFFCPGVILIKRLMTVKKLEDFCIACFLLLFLLGWAIKWKVGWLLAFDKIMIQIIYAGICDQLTPIAKILSHISEFPFCLVLTLLICLVLALLKKGWSSLIF